MSTDNNLQSNAVWQSVSQITGKPPNAIRYAAVAASLLLLVLISWVGLLDGQSKDYIDSSLKQALVTYGVARGVNAFVSVLQTIHLVGLGVGEVLDPINGLVERFSGVMEWAIGSIFIQKVLLEISASFFFKAALTVSGGLLALSLYVRTGFNTLLLSRVFMTLAFARFSIALMLILNGSVTTVRISAIVDACFRLIVDGVSAPSWTRGGCAQARSSMYLNRPRSV